MAAWAVRRPSRSSSTRPSGSSTSQCPLGAPAIYRNLRRWLESIDIKLGRPAKVPVEPITVPVAAVTEAS